MRWLLVLLLFAAACSSHEALPEALPDGTIGVGGKLVSTYIDSAGAAGPLLDSFAIDGLSDDDPEDVGTAAAGTGTDLSRSDHAHGAAAGTSLSDADPDAVGTTAAPGSGTDASRYDHVHVGDGASRTLSDADPEGVGTTAPGTGASVSRADHVHAGDGAPRTLSDADPEDVGTTAPGTGATVSRVDHVHAGDPFDVHDDVPTGATIASTDRVVFSDEGTTGDPNRYTTAAGVSNFIRDHIGIPSRNQAEAGTSTTRYVWTPLRVAQAIAEQSLSLTSATPEDVGTAAVGTSADASRADHVHGGGSGGGVSLSDSTPEDVGTAAAGSGTDASRDDHVHGGGSGTARVLSDDDPEDVGTTAPGTDTEVSRADHVHGGGGGGGGGTGDITAVTTASNSGLAGGADSGAADLSLSLSNLVGQASIAGGDHLGFDDVSATATKRITLANFAHHLGPTSGGLAATTAGQLGIRIHGLTAFSAFEGSDEFVLSDDSTTNNTSHKATLANVAAHLAGTGLDADSDGVLSVSGGGGGGGSPAAPSLLGTAITGDRTPVLYGIGEDMTADNFYEVRTTHANGRWSEAFTGSELLALAAQAAVPTTTVGSTSRVVPRLSTTSLSLSQPDRLNVWRGADGSELYLGLVRDDSGHSVEVWKIPR